MQHKNVTVIHCRYKVVKRNNILKRFGNGNAI